MIIEPPLVSIITATLDAAEQFRHTLRSIEEQTGASFEWIVIDGGSRDGTVELLRQYQARIAHWRSEPDAGIYDAWNKGCAIARGEWFLFLGAGDELASPDALAEASIRLRQAHPAYDLVYGRLRYVSPVGRRVLEEVGVPWSELESQWDSGRPALPPQSAIFHHRSLFTGGGRFDASYRIAGDVHFLLRYAMCKPLLYFPVTVVLVATQGMSMNLHRAAELTGEIRRLNRELGIVAPFGHRVANGLLVGAKVIAGRLPVPIGNRIADLYRRLRGRPERWSE